jgi:hypothetical protein
MSQIENLYRQIGQAIVERISDEWVYACLTVEFRPGVIIPEGRYLTKQDELERDFRVGPELTSMFDDLRSELVKAGQPEWCRAIFKLWPNGIFELNFEYVES